MDDAIRREIVRENLKVKFHNKKEIMAKYTPQFPVSAEREYLRFTNELMSIEKQVLIRYLPEIKQIINQGSYRTDSKKENEEKRKTARFTAIDSTFINLHQVFEEMSNSIDAAFGLYNVKQKLMELSGLTQKLSVKEWKKVIEKTLGIDLLEDYYKGDIYKQLFDQWISDNVDLITKLPKSSLDTLKQKVYEDYMDGKPTTSIVKEMQKQYGMSKSHANLIARDQTAKLNSTITKAQHADAGIKKYKWSSCRDQRVRDCHKELNGKIFSWNAPPEMYYVTKKGVKRYTGRKCHPGEDYQCRCCAIPVFDLEELDIPT